MNNKHLLSNKITNQNESNDYYNNQFISTIDNQNKVITDNRFQREVLLEKLMDESIPKMDVVKKAVEKDNDNLPKEDNKENFFQEIMTNVYHTLSPKTMELIHNNNKEKDNLSELKIKSKNNYKAYDNDIIYNICHGFNSFQDFTEKNISN
jgi:hypothetical protein